MSSIKRLQEDIETLRSITDPCEGGVTRIGFTPTYRRGVEYVKKQMAAIGLDVHEDEIGNVHGVLPGKNPGAPRIISGSHLDTVRNAGAFDGIAGVVCGLEVARLIKERGIELNHTYEIIGFIEEEGTHFGQVLLGSRFLAGLLGDADKDRFYGQDGQTLRQILDSYMEGIDVAPTDYRHGSIRAFLEVHDEQGPVLAESGTDIGIVQNIVGIAQFTVTVTGFAGHAGTVPMNMRQDACVAASTLISAMSNYVLTNHCSEATLTVGKVSVHPNSSNCIPDKFVFSIDLRSGAKEVIEQVTEYISTLSASVADEYNVAVDLRQDSFKDAVQMDRDIQLTIEKACSHLNLSYRYLNSGAGHDSMIMAGLCPTAMIFIPCEKGITHHPLEKVEWTDMVNGTELLLATILELDKQ